MPPRRPRVGARRRPRRTRRAGRPRESISSSSPIAPLPAHCLVYPEANISAASQRSLLRGPHPHWRNLPDSDNSRVREPKTLLPGLPNVEDQPPADGTPAFRHERSNPPVGCILLLGGDVQEAYTDRPTQ